MLGGRGKSEEGEKGMGQNVGWSDREERVKERGREGDRLSSSCYERGRRAPTEFK
jgi:hypothetical protein